MPSFRLAEIAERFELPLQGNGATRIDGVATLQNGRDGAIGFLANRQYRRFLPGTALSAVILGPSDAPSCPVAALISDDPYLSYARIAALFIPAEQGGDRAIHSRAVVDPDASLGANVRCG